MKKRILNLSHAGYSGDIIYSLPLAESMSKNLNGLVNYVVIRNKKSSLSPGMSHPSGSVLMNKKSFEFIKPLLESLNYVNEVLFLLEKDIDKDCIRLDFYRDNIGLNLSAGHVPLYARKYFGLEFSLEQKWLDVEPINLDQGIVCCFSRRYRNISLSYDFLDQFDNVFFVGLRDEYEHFIKINDLKRCKYYEVENAFQMARFIAGARLFLGNQSFGFSLAEAIKVNRALEVCEICPNVLPMGHGAHDYINEHALFEILKKHGFFVKRSKRFFVPSYVLYYDDLINKDNTDFQIDRQLMQLNKVFSGVLQKHINLSEKENDNGWIPDSVSLYISKLNELGDADLPLAVKNYLETVTKNQDKDPAEIKPESDSSLYTTYLTRHHSPFHPDDPLPADSPTFTFVVPCPASDLPLLADTLDSLGVQSAPLWRLVVVADSPAPDAMWAELPMLRWREVESAEGIGAALAEELAAVESGWVSVLAPGVRLAGDAVEQLVRHALAFPQWRLMYGDSDTVEADGTRRDPLFRPDVNLDLLRSMPYLGPCLWVEREAFAAVGGWGECGEAWRYDLALRVLDAFGEDAIGHVDEVLYSVPVGREEAVDEPAHRQALAAHLARRALDAEVAEGYVPGTWRVVYHWPRQPRVSIVIPTKDQADYLQSCVESIRAKTNYPDYEILVVDNGSTQPEACAYLERLKAEGVRVLPYPKPFNFSAMCNLAAREASGEYLLLLNNDTVVLQEHWLERMVAYGQRPDVGIVGVKLMFPQPPTVQHVGVILGLGGIAEHPYLGLLGLTDSGYMNRALVDQDLSAVTAACLLIRKSVWEEVKGLDEQAFRVSYNDVDLCLKVRERGYKIVWTPFVVLVHHGSVSQQQEAAEPAKARKAQQRFGKEQEAMLRKWLPQLARDPAYNRHLSLTHRDYRVESEIVVNWDPRLSTEKVRVLGWEQLSGVIEYRIKQPLEGLWQARAVERSFIHAPGVRQTRIPLLVEVERAKPDVFTASAFLELSDHLETVQQVRELAGIPFLLHLDDLISEIPRQSEVYEHRNTPGEMKRVVRTADRVVVTTEPIRAAIEKYAREVRLIPNYLPGWVWNGLQSQRRVGPRPRVGWAGAMQHAGDLALIREVVEATSEECDWVFFGMCPEELRPFVKEFHPFVPFEQYPAKLASLNLDLAVAPLEVNRFNECKSNLRILEYGILGWPVVCSDVLPYRGAPVTRVPNRPDAWLEAIRARIHDLDAAQKEGDALRQWVREGWMLEDHLGEWLEAYRFGR